MRLAEDCKLLVAPVTLRHVPVLVLVAVRFDTGDGPNTSCLAGMHLLAVCCLGWLLTRSGRSRKLFTGKALETVAEQPLYYWQLTLKTI